MAVSALQEMAAEYNPRKISPEELGKLRRSLRYFGFVEPVVINRRSQRIVGGHQRVRAAAEEGFETLPVVFVDLDEPSEKQLNLALNRISGEWDDEKLREVLASLDADGADLKLTGFDERELEKILADAAEAEEAEPELGAFEYRVVVDCKGEVEQAALIEQLEKEGWTCRPLIS